uniref:Odorant receptor n=3 Tax=Rhodnius prolixus TaxID=13249 RepID=T1HDN0_RHOPR
MQRIRSLIQHFDRYSDEVAEKCIIDEYNHLLKVSLFYPSLKSPLAAGIHLLQFVIYVVTLIFHLAIIAITVIKSQPQDFLIVIHTVHFGFIMFLFLSFIFMTNSVRYELCISHKIIGQGVYTYEDEEVSDEESNMKRKYEAIKRKLKLILPSMNLVAGLFVVVIGPWVDSILASGNLKTFTDSGINLALPVPIWHPLDTHDSLNFYIAFYGECICAHIVIVILASASCCYFTCTLHVIIQLERLIMSVRNLEKRAISMYRRRVPTSENQLKKDILYENAAYMECLEFCFRQNIQHHLQILRFNRLVNILTRGPVFATFFAGGVILGMSALVITLGNEKPGILLGTLSVAMTELANITAICKAGQTITDLNEDLHLMFYSVPWQRFSKSLKSSLYIVQEMTCRDMIVNGMFNFTANMETYGSILNTAYSCFSLLIAFKSAD